MAKNTKDYQSELKDLYDTGITDRQINEAKQKQKEISPLPVKSSGSTPEPTFKSDIDNMVSGVKKFNDKVNDITRPVRKILEKAAGKEEQGIIGQFTKPNEYSKDNKAKGIDLKVKSIDVKDKVIPMTKEDKEVLNSPKFKRASEATMDKKKGGMIKASASSRADGCAVRGKTRA